MEVHFRVNSLKKAYEFVSDAEKRFGEPVARKYIQRINLLKQARNVHEVMELPGLRCHPLKGDRKGQYAITLDFRYRLIFTVTGTSLEVARIEEVSKHYDD